MPTTSRGDAALQNMRAKKGFAAVAEGLVQAPGALVFDQNLGPELLRADHLKGIAQDQIFHRRAHPASAKARLADVVAELPAR